MGNIPMARVAVVALALALAGPASGEMLMSSSFEEPDPDFPQFPAGWLELSIWHDTSGVCAWIKGEGHRGERCVRIVDVKTRRGFQYTRQPTSPQDALKLTGWIRAEGVEEGAYLALRWFDKRMRPLALTLSQPMRDTEGRWRRCVLEAVAPAGAAYVSPVVLVAGGGAAWFDDVRLYRREGARARWLRAEVPAVVRQGTPLRLSITLEPKEALADAAELIVQLVHLTTDKEMAQKRVALPEARRWKPGEELRLGPFEVELPEYAPLGRYRVVVSFSNIALEGAQALYFRLAPRESEGFSPTWLRLTVEPVAREVRAGQELPVALRAAPVNEAPEGAVFGYVSLFSDDGRLYAETWAKLEGKEKGELLGEAFLPIPEGIAPGEYIVRGELCGRARTVGEPRAEIAVRGARAKRPLRSLAHGTFVDERGVRHRWVVERDGTLIWDGEPWLPVGGVVATQFLASYPPDGGKPDKEAERSFREAMRRVAAAGVRDVLLTPAPLLGLDERPAEATQRIVDRFEELGLRYGIQLGGAVDEGYAAYLVTDEFAQRHVPAGQERVVNIPYPTPPEAVALVVAMNEGTGKFLAPMVVPIVKARPGQRVGVVSFTIGREATGETYSVFVVPEVWVARGRGVGDIWTNFARRRAQVVNFLRKLRLGEGFRFFLDPLCAELQLRPARALPTAKSDFCLQFAQWLAERYGEPKRLCAAWGIAGELPNFQVAARLVPVPTGGRGIVAVDPEGRFSYVIPPGNTTIVADIEAFREQSIAEMLDRLCEDIRHEVADVPIVITRHGETRRFFLAPSAVGGPTGIGAQPFGGPNDLAQMDGVMAIGESLLSERTVWPVVCGTREYLVPPPAQIGYSSRGELIGCLKRLGELGFRGIFCVAASADGVEELASFDMSQAPGQLGWLAAYATMNRGKRWRGRARIVFTFPAARPAWARGLEIGGAFGLDGNFASRPPALCADGCYAVPAAALPLRCPELFLAHLPRALGNYEAARELDAAIAAGVRVCYVGQREDLGMLPALDQWFTEELAPCGAGKAQVLKAEGEAEVLGQTAEGAPWHIRAGELRIVSRWPLQLDEALTLALGGAAEPAPTL